MLTSLSDEDIADLIEALQVVSGYSPDYTRQFGVCHWVGREVDMARGGSREYSVYAVLSALGMVWPEATVEHGELAAYFCNTESTDTYSQWWVGEAYARRMRFVQFCIDELRVFMHERAGGTCIHK